MTADLRTPWPPSVRYLHTGGLVVDLCYRQIIQPAGAELPQRLFDLLLLLMAEPNTLHTRSELFERLWPGLVVEDANLTQSVWLLRKALGEDRKAWIRTVAKGGYVFEPPGLVEAWTTLPASMTPVAGNGEINAGEPETEVATELANARIPSVAGDAAPAANTARLGNRFVGLRLALVLAGVVLLAGFGLWKTFQKPAPAPTIAHAHAHAHAPVAVALVTVKDPGNNVQWPARLLHEWVKWKLTNLPEVTLLSEAELAAGAGAVPPHIVFLSSGEVPDDSGKILIRARFQEAGREQRIQREGDPDQVPGMVDALSREILRRLVPQRAEEPWPKLKLNASAAQRYSLAADAFEHRNWMTAAALQNEVLALAPDFGLARIQLAVAQSRLAQASSAVQQMDRAVDSLQPLPADVREMLRAQRLALEWNRRTEAAEAYGKLLARYPDQPAIVLQYAQQLIRSERPEKALPLLEKLNKEEAPLGTRIARLLVLSDAYRALVDPDRMRQTARAAERLTRNAGKGWELERGSALLMIAVADRAQYGPRSDVAQFEEAARQLERGGNATGALYARVLAEIRRPSGAVSEQKLGALLAQANAGGYREIEMSILLALAQRSQDAGDLDEFRRRAEEASGIARVAGEAGYLQRIDNMMVFDDYLRARLDSADARMRRLNSASSNFVLTFLGSYNESLLAAARGNVRGALEDLGRAERSLPAQAPGAPPSEVVARLACGLAQLRIQAGDLAGAREDAKRCAKASGPGSQVNLMVVRAAIDRLAGDTEAARTHVRRAQTMLADLTPDVGGWISAINVAQQLTRLGEVDASDALLRPLPARVAPTGYTLLSALIDTGLAENAAARGDWKSCQQYSAAARNGIPEDLWVVRGRLGILDTAAALAAGERERAIAIGRQVHEQARRLGDTETQLQIHSLLPGALPEGNNEEDRLQIARTGMRGATAGWLRLAPQP